MVLVANKVDDTSRDAAIWEMMALGIGEPVPISALHGRGTGDLLDILVAALLPEEEPGGADLAEREPEADGERVFAVAIVGRPNVGKSTPSTASSARSAPSCTTSPARPATPSTRWSRPTTA